MPSDLEPDLIVDKLTTRWLGRPYYFQADVDSTNTQLRDLAISGAEHGTVLVAEQQSRGHGRAGRSWQSPAGVNLYVSVLLRPAWNLDETPWLSLVAGVAVAEAVEPMLPVPPQLKWPNDVYCQGRKLAGILSEAGSAPNGGPFVIVGIGLNVNQTEFPPPLDTIATSLACVAHKQFSRANCLAVLLYHLESWVDRWQESGWHEVTRQWIRRADWLGKPVRVQWGTNEMTGIAMGLNSHGGLVLRDDHGTEHTMYCGDATLLLETVRPDAS